MEATKVAQYLTALAPLVAEAERAAERCEATLHASWPAGATSVMITDMLGGAVIQWDADKTDSTAATTFHCIRPDAVAADGSSLAAVFPALPGGSGLDRLTLNAHITGVCSKVLTNVDASGTVVGCKPDLVSYGMPVTVTCSDTGDLLVSYDSATIPDSTLVLNTQALQSLQRAGEAVGLQMMPWREAAGHPRHVSAADSIALSAWVSQQETGHAACCALATMGIQPPVVGNSEVLTPRDVSAFCSAAASVAVDAARLGRLLAASTRRAASTVSVAPFDDRACGIAIAMLQAALLFAGACADSPVAMTVARDMAPRAGVAQMPASARPGISGALARAAATALPAEAAAAPLPPMAHPPLPGGVGGAGGLGAGSPSPGTPGAGGTRGGVGGPLVASPHTAGTTRSAPDPLPLRTNDVAAHFVTSAVRAAAMAGARDPTAAEIYASIGGVDAGATLSACQVPPRRTPVLPRAAAATAIKDIEKVAKRLQARGTGGARAMADLLESWRIEGPPGDDDECQGRLQELLDEAAAADARAPASLGAGVAAKDFPFGAAASPPLLDNLKVSPAPRDRLVREHAAAGTALTSMSEAALILAEHSTRTEGGTHSNPIAELARIVSTDGGMGPDAGKFVLSSGKVTGELGALPTTLLALYPALHANREQCARAVVTRERLNADATLLPRVVASVEAILWGHFTDLRDPVRLYGGERPGQRRASSGSGDAVGGTFGDPTDPVTCREALATYESWIWEMYEALGYAAPCEPPRPRRAPPLQ